MKSRDCMPLATPGHVALCEAAAKAGGPARALRHSAGMGSTRDEDAVPEPGKVGVCEWDTALVSARLLTQAGAKPPTPTAPSGTADGCGNRTLACGPDGAGRAARTAKEGAARGSFAGLLLGQRSPGNPGLASPKGRRQQAAGGGA